MRIRSAALLLATCFSAPALACDPSSGSACFNEATISSVPLSQGPFRMADLNGDGRMDLVTVQVLAEQSATVATNSDAQRHSFPATRQGVQDFLAALNKKLKDKDKHGRGDPHQPPQPSAPARLSGSLVVHYGIACPANGGQQVCFGDGQYLGINDVYDLELTDLNGDGAVDLLVNRGDQLAAYLQPAVPRSPPPAEEPPPAPVLPSSCKAIKAANPGAADGIYTVDPDGAGSLASLSVYCDMTTDGGGWTLISKYAGSPSFPNRCLFWDNAACNASALLSPMTDANAKLENAVIAAIAGQTLAEFRAVGGGYDTVVVRHDGLPVMDPVQPGSAMRCRNTLSPDWVDYRLAASFPTGSSRHTTWTSDTSYVGFGGAKVCGDAVTFATSIRPDEQYVNAGYTATPAMRGVFYVR